MNQTVTKEFTNEELDNALNQLPIDGGLTSFEYKDAEDEDETFLIYNYIQAMDLVKMQVGITGGRSIMMAASLTNKGILFITDGGFEAVDNAKKIEQKEKIKDRTISIKATWINLIGTLIIALIIYMLGYFIGKY